MIGEQMHKFAKELWPLNRSLTGEGVRLTLNQVKNIIPNLKIYSVPSATKVFDWEIPQEWHVNKAYIVTPKGEKICNYSENNLHLLGYSSSFEGDLTLDKLKENLYMLPSQPNAIPYVTSYYKKRWGFCISKNQFDSLDQGTYKVLIDTNLFDGELNYGEIIIPGKTSREVFLSTYICHPSMANNELSGITVTTFLAKWLNELKERRFTYRIIFIPETIGSITYLSFNYKEMINKTIAGFNISCIGDDRAYSYLPSRNGNTISDYVAKHVLKWIDSDFISYSWFDRGSDERQYCAPFIDLPVASIFRSKYNEYPEYHTSLDDLENVVTPKGLQGGFFALQKAIELIEKNHKYKVSVLGEPQMSKRGLFPTLSTKNINKEVKIMMDFISQCDGGKSLLEIAETMNLPAWELYELVEKLKKHKVISSRIF